ncbi:hypothetical protein L3Y34_007472 [Caenorhabditis briggsae]|uniref:NADP-dependent oxidoreductase domain-containing protein n=2 Tax=Caenorhabditis briggsae TaxID=6238 RepID=A0AAE9D0X6_CAEBR|nr:hypothetical protein L3Y34_007472 [Caenorhabditis briggsae]
MEIDEEPGPMVDTSDESDIGEDMESYVARDPYFDRFTGRTQIPHRVKETIQMDVKTGERLGNCARMHYSLLKAFMNRVGECGLMNVKDPPKHMLIMSDSHVNATGGSHKLNTGFHIPLVGFGTYKVVGDDVMTAIDAALTAGYRMFDTAKYYNNEKELGEAIKVLLPKHGLTRSDIFLTTKFFPERDDCRKACENFVEESLKNLNTNYIDMYLVHYPKPNVCDNDDEKNAEYRKVAYQVLEEAQAAGKIRSVGVSNYEIKHLEELKTHAKVPPCANQVEYHPHFVRKELHDYCKMENIFFQAFSSLARHEKALIEDPVVVELAKKHQTTVPLVLLAWALRQDVGIVPKSVTPARIAENFKVIDVKLSPEDIKSLAALDKGQHYIRCTGWLVK